jgi:hypothetical protein
MVELKELKCLDLKDRYYLWGELWESIVDDMDIPISDHEKKILDERYEKYHQNPDQGCRWNELYDDLKAS